MQVFSLVIVHPCIRRGGSNMIKSAEFWIKIVFRVKSCIGTSMQKSAPFSISLKWGVGRVYPNFISIFNNWFSLNQYHAYLFFLQKPSYPYGLMKPKMSYIYLIFDVHFAVLFLLRQVEGARTHVHVLVQFRHFSHIPAIMVDSDRGYSRVIW